MKKILVLGAGRVARPCVAYLQRSCEYSITIVDTCLENLEKVAGNDKNTQIVKGNALDEARHLIRDADLVISLLPASLQPEIARLCIDQGKDYVNAGYATPEMKQLDAEAASAGVLLLCEMGLDPGIDHMSAKRTIDTIHREGGKVLSFRSLCGALPVPESNNNPLGYKLSWSPADLIGACVRPARYLEGKNVVDLPGHFTLKDYRLKNLGSLGWFEEYPNMDSTPYVDLYGIPEAETVYRGTIRYIGWCDLVNRLVDLGYFDNRKIDIGAVSYADMTCRLACCNPEAGKDIAEVLSVKMGVPSDSVVIKKMEWLGLLSEEMIPEGVNSARDVLASLFSRHLVWSPGERDIVILQHEYIASFERDNSLKRYISTLVDLGNIEGVTSIAKTTGLPVGIGADMILKGTFKGLTGIHIPVMPEVYEEVLKELERNGISFVETTEEVVS